MAELGVGLLGAHVGDLAILKSVSIVDVREFLTMEVHQVKSRIQPQTIFHVPSDLATTQREHFLLV